MLDVQHHQATNGLEWSENSKTILASDDHGQARLWDAQTGALRTTLVQDPPCPKESFFKRMADIHPCGPSILVSAYFVSGGGVLTLSASNTPKLWDRSGQFKTKLALSEEKPDERYFWYPTHAVLNRDKRLVARQDEHGVALLDTGNGQVRYSLGDIGELLNFSPDGRKLLVLRRDSKGMPCYSVRCDLQVYDIATGHLEVTFVKKWPESYRYWSPNGALIITVSGTILDTRTGRVIDLPYNACVVDRLIGDPQCDSFIFSADGRVALKLKNPLKLWDTETGELLTRIDDGLRPAKFSPANLQLLLTRGKDKTKALLWEIAAE